MEEGKKNSTESPPPLLKGGLNATKKNSFSIEQQFLNELIQKRELQIYYENFIYPGIIGHYCSDLNSNVIQYYVFAISD